MQTERSKEPPKSRHEYDAPDDGQLDDMVYVAKLKRSGRPRKLTAAILLLLLTMRREGMRSTYSLRVTLAGAVGTVATQLAAWLTTKLSVRVSAEAIAADLLNAIVEHATKAAATLSGPALAARLGLIVQAEVQRATAAAVKRAADGLGSITRMTTSANPCENCAALEGTYSPPYPADLWYSHPRCACVWSVA